MHSPESILDNADLAVIFIANGDISDIALVDFEIHFPPSDAVERCLEIIGCMGFIDYEPVSAFKKPLDIEAIDKLSSAYVAYFEARLLRANERLKHLEIPGLPI